MVQIISIQLRSYERPNNKTQESKCCWYQNPATGNNPEPIQPLSHNMTYFSEIIVIHHPTSSNQQWLSLIFCDNFSPCLNYVFHSTITSFYFTNNARRPVCSSYIQQYTLSIWTNWHTSSTHRIKDWKFMYGICSYFICPL